MTERPYEHMIGICTRDEAVSGETARLDVMINAHVRNTFMKFVQSKHGDESLELEKAICRHIGPYMQTRFKATTMIKLKNVSGGLREHPGYPLVRIKDISDIMSQYIGKDYRTIRKYVNVVRRNSDMRKVAGIPILDVSKFVGMVDAHDAAGEPPTDLMGVA